MTCGLRDVNTCRHKNFQRIGMVYSLQQQNKGIYNVERFTTNEI
jgi:hypothetical protein